MATAEFDRDLAGALARALRESLGVAEGGSGGVPGQQFVGAGGRSVARVEVGWLTIEQMNITVHVSKGS